MINKMAEQGGYFFRLAPPDRKEGYDVKVSDFLTNLLEKGNDDDVFHIAVVCVIDRYNRFASDRGISVNSEYNSSLFSSWQPSYDHQTDTPILTWDEYSGLIADYVNKIVEQNELTDNRITNSKLSDAYIEESVFNSCDNKTDSNACQNAITAGFEVKATKTKILSLALDKDVKLICSMSFCNEYLEGLTEGE